MCDSWEKLQKSQKSFLLWAKPVESYPLVHMRRIATHRRQIYFGAQSHSSPETFNDLWHAGPRPRWDSPKSWHRRGRISGGSTKKSLTNLLEEDAGFYLYKWTRSSWTVKPKKNCLFLIHFTSEKKKNSKFFWLVLLRRNKNSKKICTQKKMEYSTPTFDEILVAFPAHLHLSTGVCWFRSLLTNSRSLSVKLLPRCGGVAYMAPSPTFASPPHFVPFFFF